MGMTFTKILDKYRKFAFSERQKGDKFERLMQAYLQTDPKYDYRFKNIWIWDEFPFRKDFGGKDTGIDLVAFTHEGDYWAIQCKCYEETAIIDKPKVDSFITTSGRSFKDNQLHTVGFSQRLWISTTNKWGPNAEESIKNQNPPVARVNLYDLQESPIDWEKLEKGIIGDSARTSVKELFPHQQEALEKAHEYFKMNDRGKLIMACGTGKTFNSLRIAENETQGKGIILFLVPSIALVGQALNEWTSNAKVPLNPICICSDPKVSKKHTKNEDTDTFSVVDLALPASTDVDNIIRQLRYIRTMNKPGMTVVYSTYQSIDVIAEVQNKLHSSNDALGEFDLIICDEAHRTTGVAYPGEDTSKFIKVHDNSFIKAKKRLYMTATPRLYGDDAKAKAAQSEIELCSMDDVTKYGDEIYRIGFGEAVDKGLLSDYKVLILTLTENNVPLSVQKIFTNTNELTTDDASKLIGCINAMSKQILGDEGIIEKTDPDPMRRAVAFCQTIAVSKSVTEKLNASSDVYLDTLAPKKRENMVHVQSKHIDGTMTAPNRDELMGWLKSSNTDTDECRVLTNVRCLSEGVDVPSLDAVLFLSPRNSQVDVVQSVGRVMRKAPGKKYGYIVIPIVIPSDVKPENALDNNERYKVVWSVLNALRAHDDRFNATINKIDLNKSKPEKIVVGMPTPDDGDTDYVGDSNSAKDLNKQLTLQMSELQSVIYARMVEKVGSKPYWEQWAKEIADIATKQVDRINHLITTNDTHKETFEKFLSGLQKNINPSIEQKEAVDMLAQHTITKPVFEALFEGYSFVKNNPISVSMQSMLEILEAETVAKDTEVLNKFYESVRMKAAGIDNAEGKQKIIVELYDKFFKTAFPKMVEQLGIVYTPVEVVDFIIHSVSDVLKKEFNRSLGDENVNILDPFTGTGTFITRLIQSGLISKEQLPHKYKNEIFANEIVLLAYYIAAVNIENAYHDAVGGAEYKEFEGICLTDTFQLGETDNSEKLYSDLFPQNSDRVARQKKAPLTVIIGNPPYSVGQRSANDISQNQSYPHLEDRILKSYVAELKDNTLKQSLYDAYIKAFRWSTDRLDKNGGILCFVSNGAWVDGNATTGFRKSLEKEFSSIYVFNLRGNARTQGELRKKEAGNIFGSGSRTPISITLLVKNPISGMRKAKIFYKDIGDYLDQKEKLTIINNFQSVTNQNLKWQELIPNEKGDWINLRSDTFESFIEIGNKNKNTLNTFFTEYSAGVITHRDAWVYSFSIDKLKLLVNKLIRHYNHQVDLLVQAKAHKKIDVEEFVDKNPKEIKWNRRLFENADKGIKHKYLASDIREAFYRPFLKQWYYFNKDLNWSRYLQPKIFPDKTTKNLIIGTTGVGSSKTFSTLIMDTIGNLDTLEKCICFPLYYFETREKKTLSLFDSNLDKHEYIKRDGITDFILGRARKMYGKSVTKEDIFYYVYGFLHCPEYRKTFANDLKKMLPRLPLVEQPKDFWSFSKAGRVLAGLHIDYEKVPASPDAIVTGADSDFYKVEKMRFPKKGQKDTIIYNSKITISDIPAKAYEYVVNGKSAIEWIMDRYQIRSDKDSGITNNPNDWSDEVDNPKYILDLLLSVINVSVQTVDIVNSLPKIDFNSVDSTEKA